MGKPIRISIITDARKAQAGLKGTTGALEKLGKAAKWGAAGGLAALAATTVVTVKSLTRIDRINRQSAAAIKSTGGAAGVTAKHVEELSGRLENLTATEAESTQEGANLLLTFTNIRNGAGKTNKIFDRATESMVNMARAMGSDPKASAVQLGKALNDPIKGITALGRAGVQFDESQKKQIKRFTEAGDVMSAQKIILGELETQFGGSGKAYAASAAGQAELAGHAFGTLSETIGAKLLPAYSAAMTYAAAAATKLANLDWAGGFAKVQPAVDKVTAVLAGIDWGKGLERAKPLLDAAKGSFESIKDSIDPLVTGVQNLWDEFGPLIEGIAGIVVGAGLLLLQGALAAIGPIVELAANAFEKLTNLVASPAFKIAAGVITALLLPAIVLTATNLATTGLAWVAYAGYMTVANGVTKAVSAASKAMAVAQWAVNTALAANPISLFIIAIVALVAAIVIAYKKSDTFRAIVDKAFAVIKTAVKVAIFLVIGYFKMWVAAARLAWTGISSAFTSVVNFVKGMPGKIKGAFRGASSLLSNVGRQIVDGLKNGISNAWGAVTNVVDSLIKKIPKKIRKIMGIASPSKVTTELGAYVTEGLAVGIASATVSVVKATAKVGAAVTKGIAKAKPKRTVAQQIGSQVSVGLANGLLSGRADITAAVSGLEKLLNKKVKGKKAKAQHAKDLAKQTVATVKAIRDNAAAVLAARKQALAEYANSVKENALSFAAISNLQLGENESMSVGAIKNHLADRLSAIKTFSTKLAALAKMGLSGALYDQIVQMGPEAGLAYAEALEKSTPDQIAELNKLQDEVASSSAQLGASTAQQMHGAGVAAAQGFVDGMNSLLKQVAAQGTKMSAALVKAVKKALGIKSPSRVFAGLGQYVTSGLTVGVDVGRVKRLGGQMAASLERGFTPHELMATAVAGGGYGAAGATYQIDVKVDAGGNPVEVGRQIVKAIKAFERAGGRKQS